MITITLPDQSQRQFPAPLTVAEVAASIGAGLAKAALGGKVDGQLVDLSHRIGADARLAIVTDRDADGLEMIRHSTAHLLAYAVKELFPEAQVTIGPVIEHGFYYDFAYKRPFTPEDLAAIEARMTELARKDETARALLRCACAAAGLCGCGLGCRCGRCEWRSRACCWVHAPRKRRRAGVLRRRGLALQPASPQARP